MELIFSILFVITIIAAILVLCALLMLYSASENFFPDISTQKDVPKKCPECGATEYERIYRKWWMRLIPGTKHYRCYRCRSKFLIIFWRSALKIT